ncbi:MAG: PDDEXK-like family protein [Bellilinea sp.]
MANNLVEESLPSDLGLLQDFLINNPELDQLEALTERFNIFEVLGAVRVELRHSDFLAYLLNPNQNHGLGSTFLRRLLEQILLEASTSQSIRPIDLELWDLDDVEVRREWQSIDIFLLDETNRFAVVIENKIKSGEGQDQLKRYLTDVTNQYQGYRILAIYLTPDGIVPSLQTYIPVSYQTLCMILEKILESRKSTLGLEVYTLIQHYTQMLRRYIVSDTELSELCRTIYRKHQRALDLIFEYRPDLQGEIRDYLVEILSSTPDIVILRNGKTEVDFIPTSWDVKELSQGTFQTVSNKLLFFYIQNSQNALRLGCVIAPGPQDIRQQFLEMAINHHPFKPASRNLHQGWNNIYVMSILTVKDYEDPDLDSMKEKFDLFWKRFIETELPLMIKVVADQAWLWIGQQT